MSEDNITKIPPISAPMELDLNSKVQQKITEAFNSAAAKVHGGLNQVKLSALHELLQAGDKASDCFLELPYALWQRAAYEAELKAQDSGVLADKAVSELIWHYLKFIQESIAIAKGFTENTKLQKFLAKEMEKGAIKSE